MKQNKNGQRFLCAALAAGTIAVSSPMIFSPAPAFAQITQEDVEAEIAKFSLVNDAILSLVQAFTLVMLLPLGVRAGNQLFKHLILASM